MKKSIYDPIKEQLHVAVEYINILEKRKFDDKCSELTLLMDYLDQLSRQCSIYLRFELQKAGKNDG